MVSVFIVKIFQLTCCRPEATKGGHIRFLTMRLVN